MKHLRRSYFLIAVFAVLLAVCFSFGVGAESETDTAPAAAGAVIRVSDPDTGTEYASIAEAISAAPDGATLTLLADTSFSETIKITKSLTLTGSGTITFTGAGTTYTDEAAHAFEVNAAVNFTVSGNVTLTSATKQHVLIHITSAANVTVGGNAKLSVTGSDNHSYCIWHTAGTGATVTIQDNASLAATGGRTVETTRGRVTFRMTGGTVGGSYGFLFCPGDAFASEGGTASLFEITGGKIDTANNPIHLDGADNSAKGRVTVKIANATLNSKGSTNACIRTYAGTNMAVEIGNGAVLTAANHGVYAGSDTVGTITMTGGSVTTTNNGLLIESTASITFIMTEGAISAAHGIYVTSSGICRLDLLGGTVTGTGSTNAAVWLNPVRNKALTDLVLTVDGATLSGGYYAVCCQGYGSGATNAYMTVIIRESDPAKPTLLKTTTSAVGSRTIRMVDGSQVDLQISGGTVTTTAAGDSLIYGSGSTGYTKLTLSGGNFTPGTSGTTHFLLNNGRTMDVLLSGNFNTGEGQTGSIAAPTSSFFCQAGSTGGVTNITTTADITATKVIFRCQLGTMNVTINGGKLSSTVNISYTTFASNKGGTTNITINGGDLTTNNKANMFEARAGEMNINVYGGILHDGSYMFSYQDFDDSSTSAYFAKGWTVIDMSSGYISSPYSIFVSWKASEGNLRVVNGNITCTTTSNEMYMFARWGKPGTYNGGTATSEIIIEGGNFSFSNKGAVLYTAVVGVKESGGTATVKISGGNLDGGNYGVRTIGGAKLDLMITGGTITACKATKGTTTQPGSVIYSQTPVTNITVTGGRLIASENGCNGINIKKGVTATVTMDGNAVIDVPNYGIVNATSDTGASMNITITGGTIKAYRCLNLEGTNGAIPDTDYTGIIHITGGSFTSQNYAFNIGSKTVTGQKFKFTYGGTARTVSETYGLVFNCAGTMDVEITGGSIDVINSALFIDCTAVPTAERPYTVVVTMAGGTVKAADVALNIKNTSAVSFTMRGGALISTSTGTACIRNDNVAGSVDTTYASKIVICGTASLQAKSYGILIQNGAVDLDVYSGVHSAVNGFVRILNGKSAYASTVNIYGGILSQPLNAGGDAVCNLNPRATVNIHGFTAFGARTLLTNKGLGTASTLPGENLNAVYSAGTPAMVSGAGVRIATDSNGLRFVSTVDGDIVAALGALADEGTVAFGTLIFPASYLEGLTSYTHDTLPKYLDIPAVNGLVPDGNGGYTIRAAIVNLKEENYDRPFVAIAYVRYEVDGMTCYRYAALQQLQNARSMAQVARLALLDTKDTQEGTYRYTSTVGEGFSKYTTEQQNVLLAYGPDLTVKTIDIFMITGQSNGSGYSHFAGEFTADNAQYANGFANVLYSGYACSATGSNPLRYGTLTPVSTAAGFGRTEEYIGAELGLAETLSAYYNSTTGKTAAILKYADGGTYLSDNVGGSSARQGNWTSPSYLEAHGMTDKVLSGNLYRNFITLVKDTVAYYQVLGYDVNLCGVFWMQGCAERNYYNGIPALGNEPAVSSPTTEQVNALYTSLFQTLVSDMRSDLGEVMGKDLSEMPVIAGSISEAFGNIQSDNQTNFVNMQAQMVNAASHTYLLEETRYLATGTDSGDSAHYAVDDMVYAGQKLGEKFLTLGGHGAYIQEPAEEDYVAMVFDGSDYFFYTDLAYAINTAPDGSIVYQLKDITLYGPLNIATFSEGVIFEGEGHTINSYSIGHAMKVVGASTNITFNNLRLIHHRDGTNNAYAIYMYAGATLNITGENTYIEAYRYGIVVNQASTVNISGGTFTTRNGQDIGSAAVYVGSDSAVTVTGGTFTGVNKGAAFHINNGAANVTISGGTFTPGEAATYAINNASADATITVESNATVSKGTSGFVYNAGSGTTTY